jgi:hypothetical protein
MAGTAERLREDATALAGTADRLYRDMATVDSDGVISFELQTMLALPRAFRRRLLERAIGRVRDRSGGIDEALEAMDRTDRKPGARFAVVEGYELVLERERVLIRHATDGPAQRPG